MLLQLYIKIILISKVPRQNIQREREQLNNSQDKDHLKFMTIYLA